MWTCVGGVCTWVPGAGTPDLSCAGSLPPDSPCGRVSAGGWALAATAALLNGSFAALVKARRVQQAGVSGGPRARPLRHGGAPPLSGKQ